MTLEGDAFPVDCEKWPRPLSRGERDVSRNADRGSGCQAAQVEWLSGGDSLETRGKALDQIWTHRRLTKELMTRQGSQV